MPIHMISPKAGTSNIHLRMNILAVMFYSIYISLSFLAWTCNGFASQPSGVLCHGELLFDCIADTAAAGWDLDRVLSENKWKAYPGGAPANVACALAKLGTHAYFCGAVGEDSDGASLRDVLVQSGVDTSLLSMLKGDKTRRCMVTRDIAGDRTFAGFCDGLASESFADCRHELLADDVSQVLDKIQWSVQGTLGLATPVSAQSHCILSREVKARKSINTLIDINWRPVFWTSTRESEARKVIFDFASNADVVKLTDEEASWLFGVKSAYAIENPSIIRSNFPNCKVVLVTGGEKGCSFDFLGHSGYASPASVNVVETTGAGDAFNAGFIHSMLNFDFGDGLIKEGKLSSTEKAKVDYAVKFASAVGGLTCTSDGAIDAQPSLETVLQFLELTS